MNWTKPLAGATCTLTAIAFLFLEAGCHHEAKTSSAKATSAAAKQDGAAKQDDKAAIILAERAKLNPEDRKLVDAQEWCVASEEALGSMDEPLKLMVKGQPVFICCKSCEKSALADADKTLAKLEELKAKKKAAVASK